MRQGHRWLILATALTSLLEEQLQNPSARFKAPAYPGYVEEASSSVLVWNTLVGVDEMGVPAIMMSVWHSPDRGQTG